MDTIHDELYTRIDEILYYIWDPIGVSEDGHPAARSEYSRYVVDIWSTAKRGGDAKTIANSLSKRMTQDMSLSANPDHCRRTADAIIAWVAFLEGQEEKSRKSFWDFLSKK